MSTTMLIPLDRVKDHPKDGGLRAAKVNSPQFHIIKDSLEQYGQPWHAVSVLPPNADGIYFLIDGHQRTEAARQLGWKEIKAEIHDINEDQISLAQMIMNMATVQTTPTEYANQLKRIMANPKFQGMGQSAILAALNIKKTPTWLASILRLNNLIDIVKPLVDQDVIPLSSATYLAKLDDEEQLDFLEDAKRDATPAFIAKVTDHLNKKKAEAKGQSEDTIDPLKGAKGRTLTEHKQRFEQLEFELRQPNLDPDRKTFLIGAMDYSQWSLSLDEESRKAKQQAADQRKAEAAERAKARKTLIDQVTAQVKQMDPDKVKKINVVEVID